MWSPSGGPYGIASTSRTCLNHRILKWFRARLVIGFQNDSAKTQIFDETHKKWNEIRCGDLSRSQHVAPAWPYLLSRPIRSGSVSAFSCVMNHSQRQPSGDVLSVSSSTNNLLPILPTKSSTFDTSSTPTPVKQLVLNLHVLVSLVRFLGFILALGTSTSNGSSSSSFAMSTAIRGASMLVQCNHQLPRSVFQSFR